MPWNWVVKQSDTGDSCLFFAPNYIIYSRLSRIFYLELFPRNKHVRKDIGHFLRVSSTRLQFFPVDKCLPSRFRKFLRNVKIVIVKMNRSSHPPKIARNRRQAHTCVECVGRSASSLSFSPSRLPATLPAMIGLGRPCPFCQATLRYHSTTNCHENINPLHGLERLSRMPPPSPPPLPSPRLAVDA